jgi:hypothetical protein
MSPGPDCDRHVVSAMKGLPAAVASRIAGFTGEAQRGLSDQALPTIQSARPVMRRIVDAGR